MKTEIDLRQFLDTVRLMISTRLPASELEMVGFKIDKTKTPHLAYKGNQQSPEMAIQLEGTVGEIEEIQITPADFEMDECPWDNAVGDSF